MPPLPPDDGPHHPGSGPHEDPTHPRHAPDTPHAPAETHTALPQLAARARRLVEEAEQAHTRVDEGPPPRPVLGIAGPPGAGKSTLAAALVDELGPQQAVLVPMDGFHLAARELHRLGLADRKGAPDTFDAYGYLALLRRLRSGPQTAETVYAPAFDRAWEEPIAGSIPVPPELPLVVTEGNYLLLDRSPWDAVRGLLAACWWVALAEPERLRRLTARHRRFGRSAQQAEEFVHTSDEANSRLITAESTAADLIVTTDAPDPTPDPTHRVHHTHGTHGTHDTEATD